MAIVQPAIESIACIEMKMIKLYRVHTGKTPATRCVARLADFAGAAPEFPNMEGSFCVLRTCCDLSKLRK
jgi:hypothetical protein